MLSYPATIPLPSRTLNHLAERIRNHRHQRRSRWRRLDPGRQSLLALAHLRNGDTYTRLAAGFGIGAAPPGATSVKPSACSPQPRTTWPPSWTVFASWRTRSSTAH